MGVHKESDPEKEKKRQKALRRMGKILGKAWELPHAEHFHTSNNTNTSNNSTNNSAIFSLGAMGEKLDQEGYRYGRHGWEDFARDIGGVYNRHIHRYVITGCTLSRSRRILRQSPTTLENGGMPTKTPRSHIYLFWRWMDARKELVGQLNNVGREISFSHFFFC